MKKIILFQNGIETLSFFSLELSKALKELGHEIFLFDLLNEKHSLPALLSFHESKNTVLLTFNFTGIRGEGVFLDENHQLYWDVFHIPCINIVVDHPYYYHELLACRPKHYYHISIDRLHQAYMKRFFPEIRLAGFLPLGGTQIRRKDETTPFEERTIPILFTGNYTPPKTFEKHIHSIDEEYASFYYSIIDELIKEPSHPMEEVYEQHLTKEMGALTENDLKACYATMIFIDLYVRFHFRGEVVRTLVEAGFPVHVYGGGWEYLPCKHSENLIIGGSLDSMGCLEKMQQAKLSLNVMPWFKDGAHDRIFNSILNGAVCLSDSSIYLQEQYTHNQDIMFYSLERLDELPQLTDALLKNPTTMKSIIEAGYQSTLEKHTWKNRAITLSSLISRISQ